MSQEQLKTLTVINRFIDKSISRQQAAELLGLFTRQITRLKKGVLASGAESLIHKNTGRKPAHSVSDETKEAALKIYSRTKLSGVSFLHFKDILLADFGISLSSSALTNILKIPVLKVPKRKKSDTAPTVENASPIQDSSSRSIPLPMNGSAGTPNTPFMEPLMMLLEKWSAYSSHRTNAFRKTISQAQCPVPDLWIRVSVKSRKRPCSAAQICLYFFSVQVWIMILNDSPLHHKCR